MLIYNENEGGKKGTEGKDNTLKIKPLSKV